MKDNMKIRRIILLGLIIASAVFASFFGGAARTLFYILILIPVFSLIYTFYVYLRFRIYQTAENKIVVKGEKTPYFFALSDEDFLSYTDVKVTFMEDFSTPQNMSLCRSYHLVPQEKIKNHTEILCKYRGEYNIGVKDVIVTDYLGLLSVKYPAPSTISMSVLPKIYEIDKITLSPLDSDAKLLRFSRGNNSEPPDCENRKYIVGDSIKLVNWKISAKKQELFVRQNSDVQDGKIIFIMDMTQVNSDDYTRIIVEDKIIESALTTSSYLVRKNVPVTVVYEYEEINKYYIDSHENLKKFYSKCAGINFCSNHSPAKILSIFPSFGMTGDFVIFAVSSLTEELCRTCENIIKLDGDVAILLIGENGLALSEALDKRVIFRHIALSDEISDVLGGKDEN